MKKQELVNASRVIVGRNRNDKIVATTVAWDESLSRLSLTYYIDGLVSEDELEHCDLALTELLAEFYDVTVADNQCVSVSLDGFDANQLSGLVYSR